MIVAFALKPASVRIDEEVATVRQRGAPKKIAPHSVQPQTSKARTTRPLCLGSRFSSSMGEPDAFLPESA